MATIKAGDLAKGSFLSQKKLPYMVVEREFVNPGKGAAFVRLKLKNLRDGSVQRVTRKSQDNIEEIDVEEFRAQYMYFDSQNYFFMHSETYEQFEIPVSSRPDFQYFAREGEEYRLVRWEDEILDVKLPPKVDLLVTQAEEAVRGDTATSVTKQVVLETGLQVRVPAFIREGDKLRINVETKEYQERVNH